MLEVEILEEEKIAVLKPTSALSKEDFEHAKSIIDPFIQKVEKLNGLIIYTKDFPGYDSFSALLEHLEFIKEHHKKITKLAFVTDSLVGDLAEKIGSHFVSAKVETFAYDDFKKAKEWIVS